MPASMQITKNHAQPVDSAMKSRARRQISPPYRGQRRQQRVLCCRVQWIPAKRREIGNEHHGADGTGEVLRDNCDGQHCRIRPDQGERAEREIGDRLQDAADPEAGGKRQSAGDETAGKPAQQQRGEPDTFHDGRVFVARKTEIDDEGCGHRARKRIGEFEQHDEGEHHESEIVAKEILEGADCSLDHARERFFPRASGFRLDRSFRLGRKQRGDDADHHQAGHRDIAPAPCGLLVETRGFDRAHQEQCPGCRDQHADAIGGDVRRHAGGLLVFRKAFHAEGIDHDVLRCRGRSDKQRAECNERRRGGRIAKAQKYDRRHQQNLREHQPAAAATEQARQNRRVECVGQRRPQKFHRVGRADQCEQSDGGKIDTGLAHPYEQRRAGKGQRQARRKPKKHDDQHARL